MMIITTKSEGTIVLDERTIILGLAMGLMRWNEAEQIHELTPKGRKWLLAYCDEQIAIARMWAW